MKNIVLIFGGEAAEREVSIVTAFQLEKMFEKKQYNLLAVVLDENGKMFWCKKGIDLHECAKPQPFSKNYEEVVFACGGMWNVGGRKLKKVCDVDFAVIACHGGKGENGELVAKLNLDGIKTSVGTAEGLEIAMDKVVSKLVLKDCGVDVVSGFWFLTDEWREFRQNAIDRVCAFGFPVIVKPARQGSSVGIGVANNQSEFENAVDLALEFDDKILVERKLENFKEYNVSVIRSGKECLVSGVEEAFKTGDFLSFEDKYFGGAKNAGNKKFVPKCTKIGDFEGFERLKTCKMRSGGMESMERKMADDLPCEIRDKILEYAKRAAFVFEIYGVVRIDFLVDDLGNVFLNEMNSVPGSLAFYFWQNLDFCDKLVEVGLLGCDKKIAPVAKFL